MSKNPPAFPTEWSWGLEPGEAMQTGDYTAQYPGLTMRDWFAGQALMGWLASWPNGTSEFEDYAKLAQGAFDLADAMLARREPQS